MHERTVIVTGGGQGIGRAIAEGYAARGDTVYVFDLASSGLSETHVKTDEHIKQDTLCVGSVHFISVDVRDEHSVRGGIAQVLELQRNQEKQPRIDILINNAGITRDGLMIRQESAAWDDLYAVNLRGAFLCAKYALPHLVRAGTAYIINMSSVVGLWGNGGQAAYAASKAGLIAFTKSLAQEYASRNLLVNAIAPGFIETAMTSAISQQMREKILERILVRRLGTPSDVASLVLFLTSGQADYITGQVFVVDGGLSLS